MNGISSGQVTGERATAAVGDRTLPLVARMRFQLVGGIAFCVFLPTLLRGQSLFSAHAPDTAWNAAMGGLTAIVVGYFLMRRIGSFPGVQSGAHILFGVSAPYALVVAGFLIFRLDYSRFILLASYVFALFWFVGVHLAARNAIRPRIAVVPGGHADTLLELKDVNWHTLQAPTERLGRVAGVAVDLRQDFSEKWERFLADCTVAGVPVFHSKQVQESLTGKVAIEHLSENNFGSLLPNLAYLKVKQTIDVTLGLLLLPLFALVVLVVAPLIAIESGGPVFFRQKRMGYRGNVISIFKFRTMKRISSRDATGAPREAAITETGDERVTVVGRILRRYRIDELPQILNILRGEMSWIGPRPEAVPLSEWYEADLPFYRYRHVVRPGISGWAQVNQGHVALPADVLEKLHYDFFYIKYLSPWLDLLITLRTVATVLRGFGVK